MITFYYFIKLYKLINQENNKQTLVEALFKSYTIYLGNFG